VGKPEGKRPLGRRRRRWKDDIKTYLQEMGWGFDWINLSYDKDKWLAVANTVMNLWFPYNAGNFLIAEEVLASVLWR
jgi:hypothetical protein